MLSYVKKRTIFAILIFISVAVFGFLGAVHFGYIKFSKTMKLERIPHTAIAVVDMTKIKNEADPYKRLKVFIETQMNTTHQQVRQIEIDMRRELEEISKREKETKGQDKKILQEKQNFRAKASALEQAFQAQKNKMNEQFRNFSLSIDEKAHEIIKDMAEKNNIKLVINKSVDDLQIILYNALEHDLTQKVIDQLNTCQDSFGIPS
jgi:Skp family chaperone for outer membrane proteins